jgi:hypothetical protein
MKKAARSFWPDLWAKFCKDTSGRIVIWQSPNVPLAGWFICMIASKLAEKGQFATGLGYVSSAFLFTWAYLEITAGANYFRRLLGLVILISIVVSHV